MMLFRFCLYGFLKNQQYYDPFLILAFRQKGLSFGMIGVLIGFRAICINLMEIPSGAVADVVGRRRSMMASFVAYIGSFAVFGLCEPVWALFVAMLLFSIGEAFRTGTHKAMIFQWLEHEGRLSEKTAVYGHTRSWSQLGSAVSVVIATILVFSTEQYSAVFLYCIIPYVLGIVNFMGYPSYLDGSQAGDEEPKSIRRMLFASVSQALGNRPLRGLLLESMGYDGLYGSTKDYVQPIIKAACLSLPVMVALGDHFSLADRQRVAIGVGVVYFTLYLLSSVASAGAGRFAARMGGDERSARVLWAATLGLFAVMAAGIFAGLTAMTVVTFVLLAVFHNLWRPVLVSRVASHADPAQTATILSIDSQASSLFLAVVAPLLGWSVDWITSYGEQLRFLPVAGLGIFVAGVMVLRGRRTKERRVDVTSAENP
ncbi:MAG: MFS transporter [Planctomycetaceae bacterium]|nr:MFS transporter [Planctomycetaceae bacterium]